MGYGHLHHPPSPQQAQPGLGCLAGPQEVAALAGADGFGAILGLFPACEQTGLGCAEKPSDAAGG